MKKSFDKSEARRKLPSHKTQTRLAMPVSHGVSIYGRYSAMSNMATEAGRETPVVNRVGVLFERLCLSSGFRFFV